MEVQEIARKATKPKKAPRRLRRFSVLRFLALSIVYGLSLAGGTLYLAVHEIDEDLPRDLTAALDYWPQRASLVYSTDGELIGEFYLQKRIMVDLDRVPLHVQRAFIAAEDQRFLEHPGFDLSGMVRAGWANWRASGTKQGASTITQQVTRMMFLTNERTYRRKAQELVMSVRVERELTKREILHIYLNHVYLGHGAYGVEAAADVYFGKHVDHLTVAEGSMLAGLVKGPSRYSPHVDMDRARQRQLYVLERMHALGHISTPQWEQSRSEPLAIIDDERPLNNVGAPYFVEHIRRWAVRHFGEETVLHGGLRIYTTLDTHMQRSAEAAVRDGLEDLDDRIGFRGPLAHLEGDALEDMREGPARPHVANLESVTGGDRVIARVPYVGVVVETSGNYTIDLGPLSLSMIDADAKRLRAWRGEDRRQIAAGDLLPVELAPRADGNLELALAQRPDVQGAMVVLDQSTGRVRAMVGGYDFASSQFNRATQAKRQIGSAIKPFIYAAALEDGMNQLDIVADAPVAVKTAGGVWAPGNYDNTFIGNVTLRTALAKSLNTVSVRLLVRTGVDKAVDMMRALGIHSPIPRHVSIALGTPDLSLLEVVSAYAAFPAGGRLVEPRFVDKVLSGRGDVIFDDSARRPSKPAISPELAYTVVDLMGSVVDRGTARRAQELGRPAAGKTGTSTGHRDAWFVGYTADLVAGVWIGRDDFTPIGAKATGGSAALPVWLQFMQAAHPNTEPTPFAPPPDVVFVRADEMTGEPAAPGSSRGRLIPFAIGTVPERFLRSIEPRPFRPGLAAAPADLDP